MTPECVILVIHVVVVVVHEQPYDELLGNFSNRSGLVHELGSRKRNMVTTQIVSLTTGVIGTLANAVVLALLVHARRCNLASNVNSLIANQSVLDLCSCFFHVILNILKMTNACIM